jgi:hypothetical protein
MAGRDARAPSDRPPYSNLQVGIITFRQAVPMGQSCLGLRVLIRELIKPLAGNHVHEVMIWLGSCETQRVSNLTPCITRPPAPWQEHDRGRVAGRVHAVVRLRLALAHLTSSRPSVATNDLRYALRYRLAQRSGRTARPAPLKPNRCAIRLARASQQQ